MMRFDVETAGGFLLGALFMGILWILVGCASVPVGGDFCAVEHPTRLTSATVDAMTDAEVNDAVAHNRKGEKLCGWKP
jgi:hypothetical protein